LALQHGLGKVDYRYMIAIVRLAVTFQSRKEVLPASANPERE
jgi:hypothetical protein